ncbi:GNAT family N-acetyltransferase [Aldersonia sp. NBC_00410]|uniref:GNAT family N-acetyltransferase n=1 Tax=Aldersonia sp. NBC_00410 TaxID=2975954 RepID=UPI00225092D2|nr:GNAT family N-acetyltransferase [Aldersonia sp. NBC_00410]MCX5045731.1 GNAT family N-acetyltransferase [Aldersonia sp. NBC_00410]
MPDLIAPTARLYAPWFEAHREWGPGLHEDGFGLRESDDVDSPVGFAAWVGRLIAESDSAAAEGDRPGCTYRWIVEGDQVLGGIALRHGLDDFVQWAGHIGFGIRPSARGRGLATWALARVLEVADQRGVDRVLVVCAIDNLASARVIERNGGEFEGPGETPLGPSRRYWITTGGIR